MTYHIIQETEDLIVVDKPHGLLTIPDRYDSTVVNLLDALKRDFGEVFVVHRLDKDTSGVVCFARTKEIHAFLSRAFEERNVVKKYLAVVEGRLPESGTIDQPLVQSRGGKKKMAVSPSGKPSITGYRTIERFRHYSLVEADIKTGRTHQIRVHFSFIGHPVCVDPLYGSGQGVYLSQFKRKYKSKEGQAEKPVMRRLGLHSHSLTIPTPSRQEMQTFTADLPKDLQVFLKILRKYDS